MSIIAFVGNPKNKKDLISFIKDKNFDDFIFGKSAFGVGIYKIKPFYELDYSEKVPDQTLVVDCPILLIKNGICLHTMLKSLYVADCRDNFNFIGLFDDLDVGTKFCQDVGKVNLLSFSLKEFWAIVYKGSFVIHKFKMTNIKFLDHTRN